MSAEVSLSKKIDDGAIEYSRKLFDNVLGWYKNADAKAQVLLGLAGTFLSFLTGSVFMKREELESILDVFGPETWMLLVLMILCLMLAIGCALMCLRSRMADLPEFEAHLGAINDGIPDKQWPETLWFFGMIAKLTDRGRFQKRLAEVTAEDEIRALSSQVLFYRRTWHANTDG